MKSLPKGSTMGASYEVQLTEHVANPDFLVVDGNGVLVVLIVAIGKREHVAEQHDATSGCIMHG